MTDDDRIAYLNGEEPAGPLDPGERIGLDDLRDLLADPATWAEPTPDLEERVVAAISAVGAPGGSRADRDRYPGRAGNHRHAVSGRRQPGPGLCHCGGGADRGGRGGVGGRGGHRDRACRRPEQ